MTRTVVHDTFVIERTYPTGHATAWVAQFATDLKAGVFELRH